MTEAERSDNAPTRDISDGGTNHRPFDSGAGAHSENPMTEAECPHIWPDGWQFSMSPWGYTVTINRVELTDTSVRYRCNFEGKCNFEIALDPRDRIPDQARQMLRWHVDQSH